MLRLISGGSQTTEPGCSGTNEQTNPNSDEVQAQTSHGSMKLVEAWSAQRDVLKAPNCDRNANDETTAQIIDRHQLDDERDRLLRNAKKLVKQMMEEAVTKKFIHEESSSIIALCVSIDACLSHGLKRRALGLFKTNSSTALVRKIAKSCASAQEVLTMVDQEERRQADELKQLKKQSQADQLTGATTMMAMMTSSSSSTSNVTTSNATISTSTSTATPLASGSISSGVRSSVKQRVASNISVHRRNLWIKYALIEKKLVAIVEHLAENASRYYEPEALMANCVSAQLLCSLLVGPCALEFSHSKTNDCYQFEEPSADELLKRHKLSNPIACLCSHQATSFGTTAPPISSSTNRLSFSSSARSMPDREDRVHTECDRSIHDGFASSTKRRNRRANRVQSPTDANIEEEEGGIEVGTMLSRSQVEDSIRLDSKQITTIETQQQPMNPTSSSNHGSSLMARKDSRRRPLALKTNFRTGALVTECHHYCCQEISEHPQARGYSFRSTANYNGLTISNSGFSGGSGCSGCTHHQTPQCGQTSNFACLGQINPRNTSKGCTQHSAAQCVHRQIATESCWSVWSPRMLHETLHQNSKSSLLYAKNNVLLETQLHGTVAGYLSLHQTNNDLILKWIPNQLINCGQAPLLQVRACQSTSTSVEDGAYGRDGKQNSHDAIDTHGLEASATNGGSPRARSLDTGRKSSSSRRKKSLGEVNLIDQHTRRLSSNMTNLCSQMGLSSTEARSNRRAQCGDDDDDDDEVDDALMHSRTAVGSSYLDLVVNLSVSRIVLLHCRFNASTGARSGIQDEVDNTNPDGTGQEDGLRSALVDAASEETLILVEADGVQRAPFKFHKGGLRWFLSCLESGLGPDRFLEPAIKLEGGSGDGSGSNEVQFNDDTREPFQSIRSAASNSSTQWLDSPTAEPLPGNTSRLDVLLRRLPSLRRRSNENKSRSAEGVSGSTSQSSSRVASPTTGNSENQYPLPPSSISSLVYPKQAAEESAATAAASSSSSSLIRPCAPAMPLSYVYRIVSSHQADWPLQTPPHSALSVASSSSGSFALMNGNGSCTRTTSKQLSDPTGVQRFRWSLSRLARFSSRTNSTSTNSSMGGLNSAQQIDGATAGESLVSLHNPRSTVGSMSSFSESIERDTAAEGTNSSSTRTTVKQCASTGPDSGLTKFAMKRDSSSELTRIESKLSNLKKTSHDELLALKDQSIQMLCETMRRQILARAFYGWFVYCRRRKIIRTHLAGLVKTMQVEEKLDTEQTRLLIHDLDDPELLSDLRQGLTWARWREIRSLAASEDKREHLALAYKPESRLHQLVYYGGVDSNELRAEVWPYLLGHHKLEDSPETLEMKARADRASYEMCGREWIKIERVIKRRDNEILAANMARVARRQRSGLADKQADSEVKRTSSLPSDETASEELRLSAQSGFATSDLEEVATDEVVEEADESDQQQPDALERADSVAGNDCRSPTRSPMLQHQEWKRREVSQDVAKARTNAEEREPKTIEIETKKQQPKAGRKRRRRRRFRLESTGSVGSDASITDRFGNNIHRIDKDVLRCDRNFWYFKEVSNLDKLRNIMCSYVWQNLDVGYVQGMCDLAAPFLVIFDDEVKAYYCFNQLMKRMVANFPQGSAMDQHFESLKYLMQVLDPKLFQVLQNNGDYTHFYFCYRWLLLDFKRELAYEDVYRVWETIWSARHVATDHFVVFLALAMVRYYRDIIIENNMDFTDTIKFFNEMAERHDVKRIITLAQDSIIELEALIKD